MKNRNDDSNSTPPPPVESQDTAIDPVIQEETLPTRVRKKKKVDVNFYPRPRRTWRRTRCSTASPAWD